MLDFSGNLNDFRQGEEGKHSYSIFLFFHAEPCNSRWVEQVYNGITITSAQHLELKFFKLSETRILIGGGYISQNKLSLFFRYLFFESIDALIIMPMHLVQGRHPRGVLIRDPVYKEQWFFDQRLRR